MTKSSLLIALILVVSTVAASLNVVAQGQVNTSFIDVKAYVRKGYVICMYNVTLPRTGTYSCSFPYNSYVISVEPEVGCKVSLSDNTLTLTAESKNASFIMVVYSTVHTGNAINFTIPILLSFNEAPSETTAAIYFTTSEFTVECEYPMKVKEMSAYLNLTHVEPGSTTEVRATLYRTESDWIIIKQLTRLVKVESYSEAYVYDYYEFENIGLSRCDVILLKFPANATILSIEGSIFKYARGVGSGKYFISGEGKSTSVTIYLVAPPGPREKIVIKVAYKVPITKTETGYSINTLMNPGYLVINGSVRVEVPGKANFKEPQPLEVIEKDGYYIGVFKVKPEENLSSADEVLVELEISTFELTLEKFKPYLIVAISMVIVLFSGMLIKAKVLRGPRVKKVHRPELAKLMYDYIRGLEEEREARLDFAKRTTSRRIYRHRVELARSRQREIRKKINRIKEQETKGDVIKAIDEFYKLNKEIRELLPRIVRVRGVERDELLVKVGSIVKKMRELAKALE